MKTNNSLCINMPSALELISFFFLGHGPTYPISDLSGSAITRGNCTLILAQFLCKIGIILKLGFGLIEMLAINCSSLVISSSNTNYGTCMFDRKCCLPWCIVTALLLICVAMVVHQQMMMKTCLPKY